MKNIFIEHPNETNNPQGYWQHGLFAFINCVILIWYCLLGIIHSIFPFVFKFSTSSAIIRSFRKLVLSDRHRLELAKYGFDRHGSLIGRL
mgnify:CR=1 FL=1|tara:strand:- start:121 stop:390 length:270 start_codon:yes stop_codon:yes gene_type:complete